MKLVLLGLLLGWLAIIAESVARADEGDLCTAAIRVAETRSSLPAGLLGAVALGESGRYDEERRRYLPWPWTVNNAGDGRFFASRAQAMAHVELLRRQGERNIDVGCLQINLMHHPEAFADLAEAFDPGANAGYAARFLVDLRRETGSWERAVERYHSADPERGRAYRERISARWDGAGGDGGAAWVPAEPAAGEVRLVAAREGQPGPAPVLALPIRSVDGFISFAPAPGRIAVLGPARRASQERPTVRASPLVRLPGAIGTWAPAAG